MRKHKRELRRMVLTAFLALNAFGCVPIPSTSTLEQVSIPETRLIELNRGEMVAVIPNGWGRNVELSNCFEKKLAEYWSKERVMGQKKFLDAFFPWFESERLSVTRGNLEKFLKDPLVIEKIKQTGLRYVILVQVVKKTQREFATYPDAKESDKPSLGDGLAASFAIMASAERHKVSSNVTSIVLDLANGLESKGVEVMASASESLIHYGFFGVMEISDTVEAACDETAKRLSVMLKGGTFPKADNTEATRGNAPE